MHVEIDYYDDAGPDAASARILTGSGPERQETRIGFDANAWWITSGSSLIHVRTDAAPLTREQVVRLALGYLGAAEIDEERALAVFTVRERGAFRCASGVADTPMLWITFLGAGEDRLRAMLGAWVSARGGET